MTQIQILIERGDNRRRGKAVPVTPWHVCKDGVKEWRCLCVCVCVEGGGVGKIEHDAYAAAIHYRAKE